MSGEKIKIGNCKDCRYWKVDSWQEHRASPSSGICKLASSDDDDSLASVQRGDGYLGGDLELKTQAEFGCVQFEAK